VNGDKAEVAGLEASYSQVFDMLPAPFDGLLAQANYTYTWSKAKLFDGRSIALPSNSRNTFNLVLGYEKGPIDIRLAGTYRDKYLDEIGGDAETDRYVDNHFQLDLSVKFKVTDNVRLYGEWVNINNAKYFAYQNYANSQRLLQYEEYGSTFKFGVKANF
jgi:TonB-dependent receptor